MSIFDQDDHDVISYCADDTPLHNSTSDALKISYSVRGRGGYYIVHSILVHSRRNLIIVFLPFLHKNERPSFLSLFLLTIQCVFCVIKPLYLTPFSLLHFDVRYDKAE